jgi:hypothetical protein
MDNEPRVFFSRTQTTYHDETRIGSSTKFSRQRSAEFSAASLTFPCLIPDSLSHPFEIPRRGNASQTESEYTHRIFWIMPFTNSSIPEQPNQTKPNQTPISSSLTVSTPAFRYLPRRLRQGGVTNQASKEESAACTYTHNTGRLHRL